MSDCDFGADGYYPQPLVDLSNCEPLKPATEFWQGATDLWIYTGSGI
jgi:hypothetical protein